MALHASTSLLSLICMEQGNEKKSRIIMGVDFDELEKISAEMRRLEAEHIDSITYDSSYVRELRRGLVPKVNPV